jgi:hypothetical protein
MHYALLRIFSMISANGVRHRHLIKFSAPTVVAAERRRMRVVLDVHPVEAHQVEALQSKQMLDNSHWSAELSLISFLWPPDVVCNSDSIHYANKSHGCTHLSRAISQSS